MRNGNLPLVRPAGPGDIPAAAELFDKYRQFYGQPSDIDAARGFLSERLDRGESAIFLAETGAGEMAGFMQLYPLFSSVRLARVWLLNDLFVAEAFRNCGVGTALMRHAIDFGRNAGADRLQLETGVENRTAQRLYEAMGWQRDKSGYHYFIQISGAKG